jgi:hypothetical protein
MSENEKGWEQDTSTNLPIRVSAMWQHPPTRTFLSFLRSRFLNNLRVFNGCKRAPWPASSFYCLDSSKENSAKLAESFHSDKIIAFLSGKMNRQGNRGQERVKKLDLPDALPVCLLYVAHRIWPILKFVARYANEVGGTDVKLRNEPGRPTRRHPISLGRR